MNNQTNISIADSSVLVSLFSPSDAYHDHALRLAHQANQDGAVVITPDAVFIETVNVIGKKLGHEAAVAAAELVTNSGTFVIVESTDLLPDALVKFKAAGERVSLTDCVVMATADRYQTRSVLGFDDDFRSSGYLAPIPLHKP